MTRLSSLNAVQGGLSCFAHYVRDRSWSHIAAVSIAFVAASIALSKLPAGQHGSALEITLVVVVLACLGIALLSRKWLPIGLTFIWLFATVFRV